MEMRQAFMLFVFAHTLGYYYLSSFRSGRSVLRLAVELLLYIAATAVVFLPVLDGNNYLYALAIIVFHISADILLYIVSRRLSDPRGRAAAFLSVEAVRLAGFAVMAFFYGVRWGFFEPWREVHFFLSAMDLDYSQVLAWLFAALVLIRPVNILVKKVLSLTCGCGPEGRHYGALTGAVERILYAAMVFYGSWIAFAIIFFAKCALFCLRIKNDPETGMRFYLGSLLSALSVIPVALTAASFI